MSKSKRTNKSYTIEEDETLANFINEDPENITRACEDAARVLPGRTATALKQRYYYAIRHHTLLFYLTSGEGAVINTKNDKRGKYPTRKVRKSKHFHFLNLRNR